MLDTPFHLGHRRSATRTTLMPAPVTPDKQPSPGREESPWTVTALWEDGGFCACPSSHLALSGLSLFLLWKVGVTLTSLGDLKPAGSSSASDAAKHSTQGNWV